MAPVTKNTLSHRESLEKKMNKRAQDRERCRRYKDDPVIALKMKEKEKEKYRRKKEKGRFKSAPEMTRRELRYARKAWREKRQFYRLKQKQKREERMNSEAKVTEPYDDPQIIQQTNNSDGHESTVSSAKTVPYQVSSGKIRAQKNKAKRYRQYQKLIKIVEDKDNKIAWLKKRNESLRKKLKRVNSNDTGSPKSTVKKIIQGNDANVVKRKLLLGESIGRQLVDNLRTLKSRRARRSFTRLIVGYAKWFRKYGLLSECRFIPLKILRNDIRSRISNHLPNRRARSISEKVRADVAAFLEDDEHSKMLPGKKDCVTKRGIKKKANASGRLKSFTPEIYSVNFIPNKLCVFHEVKALLGDASKLNQRETCQCITHENYKLMLIGLYNSKAITSPELKIMKKLICCEKTTENCFFRACISCQSKNVMFCTFDGSRMANFQQWKRTSVEYQDPKDKKMKTISRTVKVTVAKPLIDLVREVQQESLKFLAHEGNVTHQHTELKRLKENISSQEFIIHMDFSENYSTKYHEEIQSIHFGGNRQAITHHTVVVYFKKTDLSPTSQRSFCSVSESLEHSPAAVWAHLQPVFNFIRNVNEKPITRIHFLSDGPSSQYRNRLMFYLFQSRISQEFRNVELATWNYHESGHGKGAPDGIGGVVKGTADREVAQGRDIVDIDSLVRVLRKKVEAVEITKIRNAAIREIAASIPRGSIRSFPGTRQTHQVVWMKDKIALSMNRLSCFSCIYGCKNYKLGSHIQCGKDKKKPLKQNPPKGHKQKSKFKRPKSKGHPIPTQKKIERHFSEPDFLTLLSANHTEMQEENPFVERIPGISFLEPNHNYENETEVVQCSNKENDQNYVKIGNDENYQMLSCNDGLCFRCGGVICRLKPGRLCNVCQTVAYHQSCIPSTS